MTRALALVLGILLLIAGAFEARSVLNRRPRLPEERWNGERALNDIRALVRFTPRSLGTPGHDAARAYIAAALADAGVPAIVDQRWIERRDDGKRFVLHNLIARLDPGLPRRIVVATHYDSLSRAYADSGHPNAPMPGANNSASGVALLLETARALGRRPKLPIGVDLVFFDGEEGIRALGEGDDSWRPLGSAHFSERLAAFYRQRPPQSAVVFDMVCAKNARFRPEHDAAGDRNLARFWSIGRRVAPDRFGSDAMEVQVDDDQLPLRAAGIPGFLVIGWNYAPWFDTTADTVDKCSAATLRAVGIALVRYLVQHGSDRSRAGLD